ncbi:hypothetical protein TWF106_006512, partial [Orbilia oligospora]
MSIKAPNRAERLIKSRDPVSALGTGNKDMGQLRLLDWIPFQFPSRRINININ